MQRDSQIESLLALQDIRGIMERSTRFLSLSGWSGAWAGCTALAASFAAGQIIKGDALSDSALIIPDWHSPYNNALTVKLLFLGSLTFFVALAGGYFFTARKVRAQGGSLWSKASRQLFVQVMIPMIAGGLFCLAFLYYGELRFIPAACLTFYGLGLINGSKYTLSDIRYLGYLEVLLGCCCLFMPGYGRYFWAAGFGVLHIFYGIIMWNKYDKQRGT